jgi:anti-sigma B factor antagonist
MTVCADSARGTTPVPGALRAASGADRFSDVNTHHQMPTTRLHIDTISSLDWSEAIVQVVGTLDAETSPSLMREITRLRQNGASRVLLDLTDVDAIDDEGVEVLLHIRRQMHYEDGVFGVVGIGDDARESLRRAGVADVLGCE